MEFSKPLSLIFGTISPFPACLPSCTPRMERAMDCTTSLFQSGTERVTPDYAEDTIGS
jgi:hypothetical protein